MNKVVGNKLSPKSFVLASSVIRASPFQLITFHTLTLICFHQVSEYGGGARVVWAMSAGDREAEAQAKKGDEAASNDRDSRAAAALKQYWCVGLRAVELVSY